HDRAADRRPAPAGGTAKADRADGVRRSHHLLPDRGAARAGAALADQQGETAALAVSPLTRRRTRMDRRGLVSVLLAAAIVGAPVAPALAAGEDFIPLLVYRTGPSAPRGIPIANGLADTLDPLHQRDSATNYWSQASAVVRYIGHQEGGLDKLKGKKIVHIYHNSPYGKEANPTLDELSKKYQFELTLLAVDHPGQEQGATWLQVRRINPDWIFMSGWGVMNQVAVKEAASKGFKMDHFIGNWWSANDADVIPAGDGAKGYKGATFHAPGTKFRVHADIFKILYDKNKGAGRREAVGEALYNRGIVNAMYTAEAIRTAMGKFGNKPLTSEQMRWGLEHLDVTEQRLDQLGMKGFTHPIRVTCEDHEGS